MEVRTLSMNNPFAWLMLHGKIETRTRKTNVRGWVMIASCQKAYDGKTVNEIAGARQHMRISPTLIGVRPMNGVSVCMANLVDCRPMRPEDEDRCFVRYSPDRWCWIFEDVKELPHLIFKGKQGWGMLDDYEIMHYGIDNIISTNLSTKK